MNRLWRICQTNSSISQGWSCWSRCTRSRRFDWTNDLRECTLRRSMNWYRWKWLHRYCNSTMVRWRWMMLVFWTTSRISYWTCIESKNWLRVRYTDPRTIYTCLMINCFFEALICDYSGSNVHVIELKCGELWLCRCWWLPASRRPRKKTFGRSTPVHIRPPWVREPLELHQVEEGRARTVHQSRLSLLRFRL